MIVDYIDDDIIMSNEMVKNLYLLSQNLKDKPITKNGIMEMYNTLSLYGILDNSIDALNGFYNDIFEKGYNGILYSNPFIIPSNKATKFMNRQYENIETEEEMVANGVFLANRLSKIPCTIIDVKSKSRYDTSLLGWNKEKTEIMKELYALYNAKENDDFNFLSDVEFDKDNNIKDYNKEKFEEESKFKYEFRKFKIWYNENINKLLKDHPDLKRTDFQTDNLPDVQRLFRLKECESVFYQAKALAVQRAIQLKKNGKIKVFDGSEIDTKSNKDNVLLYIELPKYNAPIIVHMKKDIYENEILKSISREEIPEAKEIRYEGNPYWNFRLNDEQIKLVKSISPNTLKDDTFGTTIMYMQNSIYTYEKIKLREEKNKMKEEENVKRETVEIKAKTDRKKRKDNEEFINEDIIPVVESQLGKSLPEGYKEGLKKSPKNSNLNYVYNTIKDFLNANSKEQNEQELTVETVKMFTYMKLGQRSFWSGVNGKKDRIPLYTDISKEYKDGFDKIGVAIDEKRDVEELSKIIKPVKRTRGAINIDDFDEPVVDERSKIVEERTKSVENRSRIVEEPVNKDIVDEFTIPSDDIEIKINDQTQMNSKLQQVIQHQKEYITNQEILIGKKKEYANLLEEANRKKETIRQNENTLKEQGTKIEELEKALYEDREEK